jgi:hypothetical protein
VGNQAKFVALIGLMTVMLTTAAWSDPDMDPQMQRYEDDAYRCAPGMPLPDGTTDCELTPLFVDCLGEDLVGSYHWVGNFQVFEAPTGMVHIRDNWKVVSMLFGVVTGRAWYAVGVAPGSGNFGGIETFSTSGTLTYKPLADGPTWQEQFVYKTIQNANGEITANFENVKYKCVGANR